MLFGVSVSLWIFSPSFYYIFRAPVRICLQITSFSGFCIKEDLYLQSYLSQSESSQYNHKLGRKVVAS